MGFEHITGPNWIVATPPSGDSSNRVADTAFVVTAAASAVAAGTTGFVLQTIYNATTSFITGTTHMAGVADTIPVKTDGTQILTATITPASVSNNLLITAFAPVGGTAGVSIWTGLFQDTTTSAVAAVAVTIAISGSLHEMALNIQTTAGTTGPTVFKINVGNLGSDVSTWAVNGIPSQRILGGSSRASLIIQEIKV